MCKESEWMKKWFVLTFSDGELDVVHTQDGALPEVLEGSGSPRTRIMVRAVTTLLTALNGCSKALTICTMLHREGGGGRFTLVYSVMSFTYASSPDSTNHQHRLHPSSRHSPDEIMAHVLARGIPLGPRGSRSRACLKHSRGLPLKQTSIIKHFLKTCPLFPSL